MIVDNQTGSDIDLSSYVADLDCSAAGGDAGSIEAVIDAGGLACTGYSEEAICLAVCQDTVPCEEGVLACPGGEACLGDDGQPVPPSTVGLCEDLGSCMPVPSVDESRSDYVFSDAGSTSNNPNGVCPTVNVNAANDVPGSSVIPDGQQKYLGTFVYHVSADADGVFQLDLLGSSVLVDPLGADLDFTPRGLTLTADTICDTNTDCEDGDDCTFDVCDMNICDFPSRLYGDANNDGARNITDVVCAARVTFQDATVCGAHQVSLDEIDIAPSASCGDDQLNITDVVAHARAAFQDGADECCGE